MAAVLRWWEFFTGAAVVVLGVLLCAVMTGKAGAQNPNGPGKSGAQNPGAPQFGPLIEGARADLEALKELQKRIKEKANAKNLDKKEFDAIIGKMRTDLDRDDASSKEIQEKVVSLTASLDKQLLPLRRQYQAEILKFTNDMVKLRAEIKQMELDLAAKREDLTNTVARLRVSEARLADITVKSDETAKGDSNTK